MRTLVCTAVLLALVAGLPISAPAKPMSTPLAKVADKNTRVVVARYLGPVGTTKVFKATRFRLDILRMIRGTRLVGQVVVQLGTGHPDVKVGNVVVAFIDKHNRWSFVAEPPKGQTIATGALKVRGFYDFNAHMVWPSMVTLRQLERFIDTRKLHYRFRGRVHVLNRRGSAVVPSKIRLRGTYDWKTRKATVAGVPRWARKFPAQPQVRITSGWGSDVTLVYRGHWPRPLKIGGTVTGADPNSGDLLVRFHVTQPDLFTAKQLRRYLTRGKLSFPLWRYQIRLANGRTWDMTEHSYTGSPRITTDKGHVYRYTSFSFSKNGGAKQRNIKLAGANGKLRIDFGPRIPGAFLDERGTTRQFRQELLHGPLGCRIAAGDGAGQRCTITLRSTRFK